MARNNDINSQMFFALRVSEESRVPFLFMSAPGMGKSTTVELFANYAGYKMEILRGNSTSESEVMGYDVVDSAPGAKSTRHLRPSWFGNVLKNAENGEKTLLFVDEITTCPEHVQAALLHLIFERKVGNEMIPEDTFIVSAGNYSQSLGSSFGLLPPLMNRFCIFNIIPTRDDVASFILHHRGAALGNIVSFNDQIVAKFKSLDKKAISELPEESIMNKVWEIFEVAVNDAFQTLSVPPTSSQKSTGTEAKVDIKVSDVQSIYSDVDNDDPLCGFVTCRTLSYAVKATMATWKCFGKTGITSDNFENILTGLVGLGFVRGKNGTLNSSHIAHDFFTRISNSIKEVDRVVQHSATLENVINYYKEFIKQNLPKSTSIITKDKAGLLMDKLKDVTNDKTIANIDKPIDHTIFESIFAGIRASMGSLVKFDLPTSNSSIPVAKLADVVTEWNILADLFEAYGKYIEDPTHHYDSEDFKMINNYKTVIRQEHRKLNNAIKINTDGIDENAKSIIPPLHTGYLATN